MPVVVAISQYFHDDRNKIRLLLATVAAVYLPFIGNPFIFDDLGFFSGALDPYAHSSFSFDLRWLPYASLGWTAALFGDVAPHFFRLGNMLLHAGNVILLFYLLRQLACAALQDQEESAAVSWGAWLGALLFACHPVAVYAVGYVVQRSILMATFFALLMQWAYVRSLLGGQKRWLVLAAVAYFLAGFSKEHSVMMPAVLAALTVLLRARIRLARRALWLAWAAFVVTGMFIVLRAKGVFGAAYEPMAAVLFEQQGMAEDTPNLHLLSVLTQAGLYFKYLLLWVLPNPAWMSIDMRESFIAVWTAWQGWLELFGFAAYGLLGFGLLLRGGGRGLAGLALLYPWLLFWVEFSSIRVQEPFVLYRSYLWMPGLMLLFPLLPAMLHGRRTLLALGCTVLLLIPLAWNRLWVFADTYRLWNDAVLLLPNERIAGADRIFYNRGRAEEALSRWDAAAADYKRAVEISPKLAPVRYALGMAYIKLGRDKEAIVQFDAGIELKPDDARLYVGKGLSLMRLHAGEQARQQMEKACELGNGTACTMAGWMKAKK